MRLKRLVIKGFKSFADETVIHFNENLIGIVGPNGSGKSNIVDSIRWVLGEQKTKELRLEAMSDVIFNGSKERKEGKIAKVTLIFDNTKHILPTEFNEVSISRVLYRNGTSEYQLNNVTCRKKDITNLFIDSGIGSNSYAIISLNMVEDILQDSGGSRRHMIEQAAGISKYKVRKKETLSKLRSTLEDLDRVKDLLFEIEKNMNSFERQAKRTERFNRLKEEYKELSIKISHIAVKELNLKYRDLKEKLDLEKDAKIKLNSEIAKDEAILQKLKTNILESEKSLSSDQQDFNTLIEKLGKIENDKNLAIQKIQNAKDRKIAIKLSVTQLNDSIKTAQKELSNAKEASDKLASNLAIKEKSFEEINEDYLVKSNAYEHLREREKQLKSAISEQQLTKENLAREVESLSTRKSILESDVLVLSDRMTSLTNAWKEEEKQLKDQQKLIDKAAQAIQKSEEEISSKDKKIQSLNEKLSAATEAWNKSKVEASSIEQRISFLKNIIEKNEGLPESVKFVLGKDKNKLQVLSDIIEISDERFIKIAEMFLEPYFHYVLVQSRSEANTIYGSVRDAQKGKISVAIIDEIQKIPSTVNRKNLVPLQDVININAKFKPFINLITNQVFISEAAYKSFDLSSLSNGDVVLFPEDYLIIANGKLYGGSTTLFEGVQLGRKKLLEKLENQFDKVSKSSIKNEEELQLINSNIDDVKSSLKYERQKLSELRTNFDSDKSKLYGLQSRFENQQANFEEYKTQIEQKENELGHISKDLDAKSKEYQDIRELKIEELNDEELTKKIDDARNAYLAARSHRDEQQSILFEARSRFNLAKKDVEFFENSIADVHQRLDEIDNEQIGLISVINDGEKELEFIKKELEQQYTLKAQLQEKLSSYEDTYYKEKGRIFELEKSLGELRSKLYSKDQLINSLNERYVNIGFEIKGIHERNSIEFGIEIKETEFPEEYEGEDLEMLKSQKDKIFDRIRSYGEINPMAITAYNEIKERHEEISKERDDILDAKESLEETILEIESTASHKFNEALNNIRVNFKKVFQSLFSDDDDCDIVLLDNDDPLEAKIEIVAKPKGKRPKSINLLSGGEKTLTASSFLFALYLLKPAPFCIFDEVDAPLDDVNVLKFNKLIREFSQDSQFIIITHNKLTMQEVDILYGVYLKEQGVSGLSAVDFRTYDQTEMMAVN